MMTEEKFKKKLNRIEQKNASDEMRETLKNARHSKKLVFPSTTKLIMIYLFIILNAVLVYCLIAMWHFGNLTHLGTLITDVISQVIVFLVYCVKSAKENTKGGIVYETAMANIGMEDSGTSVG